MTSRLMRLSVRLTTRLPWAGASAGVLLLLGGGVAALASVPDSAGLIHGCYATGRGGGELRIIDTASQVCSRRETAISWTKNGPPGPVGARGPQGSQGVRGIAGVAGPDGLPGAGGSTGPRGPQGIQGTQGVIGPAGPNGPAGIAGAVGSIGQAGLPGAPGANGQNGLQGPTGAQGPPGAAGPDNFTAGGQGVPGPTGPRGPAGLSGYSVVVGPLLDLCTAASVPPVPGCDFNNPTHGVSIAACPSGTRVLMGGYWVDRNIGLNREEPDSRGMFEPPAGYMPDGLGWTVSASLDPGFHSGRAQAYAICASSS
jgi:Collagen triple helix repeat (20 copies)